MNVTSYNKTGSVPQFETEQHSFVLFVMTFTSDFVQDKLLGQTESNMETHAGAEILEY